MGQTEKGVGSMEEGPIGGGSRLTRADALRLLRTALTLRDKLLLRHPVIAVHV